MTRDDWEELVAQVEDHGPEKIQFSIDADYVVGTKGEVVLDLVNIMFEDDIIKVVLT